MNLGRLRAFTLIEIMITTAILSFGMVMIFRSFFFSLNSAAYLLNRLAASSQMGNIIWQTQDSLRKSGNLNERSNCESQIIGSNTYSWNLDPQALDNASGFYNLKVVVSWIENNKQVKLVRYAYINK